MLLRRDPIAVFVMTDRAKRVHPSNFCGKATSSRWPSHLCSLLLSSTRFCYIFATFRLDSPSPLRPFSIPRVTVAAATQIPSRRPPAAAGQTMETSKITFGWRRRRSGQPTNSERGTINLSVRLANF